MIRDTTDSVTNPELSLVIPVYNGARSVGLLVKKIHHIFQNISFEVVLVNDGSKDDSEYICTSLAETYPETVSFVHLARNFGEHSAVLAGLNYTKGQYVAVLDDDGQNPPEEVLRMLEEMKKRKYDVIYGRYMKKEHHWFRNFGSWFTNWMATIMLQKPATLYLSSFKVMNRFVVEEIIKYRGPFPYIDGLIYRATDNLGQVDVLHLPATDGISRYNFRRLINLWLNMFLNFSILPLRISSVVGGFVSSISVFLIAAIVIDKLWITRNMTLGIPTVLTTIVFFSGVQLMILGLIGEYLGRLFLDRTGTPQFVVRYVKGKKESQSAEVPETCTYRNLY